MIHCMAETSSYDWSNIKKRCSSKERKFKVGILIAAYGSSNMQSSQAIRYFQARLEAYYNVPVRIAFTSETLRKRLAHARTKSDSVLKALQKMAFERFTHVIVQSLHLIAGIEYHEVLEDTKIAQEQFGITVSFGLPLLTKEQDIEKVVLALQSLVPDSYQENDIVIWMGHGTSHEAEHLYLSLHTLLHSYNENMYSACMEGVLTLKEVKEDLKLKSTIHKVWLLPLLTVVGKHALCDMAGDDEKSWKSQIKALGFECEPYLKGLAESCKIQDIWIDRINDAILAL